MSRSKYGNKKIRQKAVADLETAIEVLDATGWCKGSLGDINISEVDGDGAHCALGSIAAADFVLGNGSLADEWLDDAGGVYAETLSTPYGVAVAAVADSISRADLAKKIRRDTLEELTTNAPDRVFTWNDEVVPADEKKGKAALKRTFRRAIKALAA